MLSSLAEAPSIPTRGAGGGPSPSLRSLRPCQPWHPAQECTRSRGPWPLPAPCPPALPAPGIPGLSEPLRQHLPALPAEPTHPPTRLPGASPGRAPPGHPTRLLEPGAGLRALVGPYMAAPKHTSNPDPGAASGVGSAASRRLSPRLVGQRPLAGVPACPWEPRCCPSPLSPHCSAGPPAPGVSHAGPWPPSGGQRWRLQTGPAGPSALRPRPGGAVSSVGSRGCPRRG